MPSVVDEILECMIEFDHEALAVVQILAVTLEGTWILPRSNPPIA